MRPPIFKVREAEPTMGLITRGGHSRGIMTETDGMPEFPGPLLTNGDADDPSQLRRSRQIQVASHKQHPRGLHPAELLLAQRLWIHSHERILQEDVNPSVGSPRDQPFRSLRKRLPLQHFPRSHVGRVHHRQFVVPTDSEHHAGLGFDNHSRRTIRKRRDFAREFPGDTA